MRIAELFNLRDRVAVVTGGGGGLGLQLAAGLADAGADVVVCSRDRERCERTAAELVAVYGVRAIGLGCDLRSREQIEATVRQVRSEFGRIDVLVNNSGTTWGAPPESIPLDAWRKVIDVNLTGTFLLTQSVGRVLIEQAEGGKIINIASIAAFWGAHPNLMNALPYNVSKGGLVAMTIDLAVKWAQHRINVNAIAPGWFPSEMSAEVLHDGGQAMLSRIPLGRFGGSDDLKGAIVFLASAASDFVTGHTLVVDGGQLAG
jgi:gluconate 5-dehydrogenase